MSSWKKASKTNQRTHRERHQPESRQHLGLLEKKKDYKVRSKNAQNKEKTLKILRKKALDRNPDEFYHHMIRSKVQDDEHRENEQPDEHTGEQIALMQTQDIKYIRMKRTIETRKIDRLQSQLHMIDVANEVPNKHIFFVDDEEEAKHFDLAKRLDTHPSLVARKSNRPRMQDLDKLNIPDISEENLRELEKKREAAYKELQTRIDREKELSVIEQKMELKRLLRQKRELKPKKIKPGTKTSAPVYKFAYERKR
ncbi:unnamed protein product [Hermetia illucens]|uniref:U3 small nucleolar RNA-associated protein 11 n=1 Tax=Hermetia illucens TaxID=343691 RepID=A0A7R8YYT2_HERIL|nr:probable U3 small nucleolar RNA-associated protein 11 [Hermetia illucens]CAD7087090.1 unnamed protein product [Hermetia illucens]